MVGLRQHFREHLQSFLARLAGPKTPKVLVEQRGFELLARHLSPSQRRQYSQLRSFDVVGGDTGKRYRIRCGRLMNIEQLDHKGQSVMVLCFGPRGRLPVGDIMLAQKVALELFETEALRVANRAPRWSNVSITADL